MAAPFRRLVKAGSRRSAWVLCVSCRMSGDYFERELSHGSVDLGNGGRGNNHPQASGHELVPAGVRRESLCRVQCGQLQETLFIFFYLSLK